LINVREDAPAGAGEEESELDEVGTGAAEAAAGR
jgi:hypothetical protein